MAIDFVEELQWRGMVHDVTPGTAERLRQGMVCGYAGFDPTAPSLQIGNLLPVMMLLHLQRAGHKPLALVGGATGMIGDPSGKSEERNLMTLEQVHDNVERFKKQLSRFLDFDNGPTAAQIVNNYDWFKNMSMLDFLRDAGKHLTISYMMAKDSVQSRLESGISFTEFSYQLLQGYDFYHLYNHHDCILQIGGSDQWGNITAGTELIRRKCGGDGYALTCPLLTKADGTKFGKSAAGERIFLDAALTSPYKFYQFWMNCSDVDASRFIRVFTLLTRQEIETLEQQHAQAPHERLLQRTLAEDITIRVHSRQDLDAAVEASQILFGSGTTETLKKLSEQDLLSIFEGVPRFTLGRAELKQGINIIELLAGPAAVFPSKGEARRMIQGGGVSVNKTKITDESSALDTQMLLSDRYLLVQKGKKNYYLGVVE